MPNSVGGSFFCQVHAEYAPLPAPEPIPESRFRGQQNVPFPTSSWTPKIYPSQPSNPNQYNQPSQPTSYFQPSYGPKSYPQNVYSHSTFTPAPYVPTTLQQPTYDQSPHWLRPVYGQSQQSPQSPQSPTVQYPTNRYRSLEINYKPLQPSGIYSAQQPVEYYPPQQPVYRPITTSQNQPQCQCGQRKRVSEALIFRYFLYAFDLIESKHITYLHISVYTGKNIKWRKYRHRANSICLWAQRFG